MQSKPWFVFLMMFTGCKAHQSPLDEQLTQLKIEARSDIQLPPLIEFAPARYRAHQLPQPFSLPSQGIFFVGEEKVANKCQQPSLEQNLDHQPLSEPSHLTNFELNRLNFKGVISQGDQHSAIVKAPTGDLALVAVGDYLGTQGNKVLKIDTDTILIEQRVPAQGDRLSKELLTDEQECWQRRTIRWALK